MRIEQKALRSKYFRIAEDIIITLLETIHQLHHGTNFFILVFDVQSLVFLLPLNKDE